MPQKQRHFIQRFRWILAILLLPLITGCALTREIQDITIPPVADPSGAMKVAITSVTDSRIFERFTEDYSTPSVMSEDLQNSAIKARAIHRKANLNGGLMGDVLLPEGRTVATVTRELATSAFRSAGISVLEPGTPGFTQAIPVQIDIQQFWAWQTMDSDCDIVFDIRLNIRSPLPPFQQGKQISGRGLMGQLWGTDEEFIAPFREGLDQVSRSITAALKSPSEGTPP